MTFYNVIHAPVKFKELATNVYSFFITPLGGINFFYLGCALILPTGFISQKESLHLPPKQTEST